MIAVDNMKNTKQDTKGSKTEDNMRIFANLFIDRIIEKHNKQVLKLIPKPFTISLGASKQ